MDRLVAEVRHLVGLDRVSPAAAASGVATATVTVAPSAPASTPGPKATPASSGSMQEDRAAELAYAMGDRQTAPAVSSRSASGLSSWGSLGSEDRAATTTLASRGATSAAVDSRFQVRALQAQVEDRLASLRQLREVVKDRVARLDTDKRTDAATIEQQLRIYDAAPKLAPLKGKLNITSPFGMRIDPVTPWVSSFHNGVDLSAWWGTDVLSTAAGKVVYSDWQGGLGWTIEIQHDQSFKTLYGHNQELLVRVGQQVTAGQLIARVGDSGRTTGPHVHYEIWFEGHQIDPLKYMGVSASGAAGQGGAIVQPKQ